MKAIVETNSVNVRIRRASFNSELSKTWARTTFRGTSFDGSIPEDEHWEESLGSDDEEILEEKRRSSRASSSGGHSSIGAPIPLEVVSERSNEDDGGAGGDKSRTSSGAIDLSEMTRTSSGRLIQRITVSESTSSLSSLLSSPSNAFEGVGVKLKRKPSTK